MENQIRKFVEELFRGQPNTGENQEKKEKLTKSLELKYRDLLEVGKTPEEALEIIKGSVEKIEVHPAEEKNRQVEMPIEEHKEMISLNDRKKPQNTVSSFIKAILVIIIGLSIILLLIVLSHQGTYSKNKAFINISDGGYTFNKEGLRLIKQEDTNLTGIDDIILKMGAACVQLEFTEDERLSVKEHADDSDLNQIFNMTKRGSTLSIERKDKKLSIGKLDSTHLVEVFIPLEYKEKLSVATTSGDIQILSDVNVREVGVSLSSGSLYAEERIQAEKVNIASTSGDLLLKELSAGQYEIASNSGQINIEHIEGKGDIASTSGDISLSEMISEEAEITATSGNIKIQSLTGSLEMATASGEIEARIENLTGNLKADSGSGDVRLDFAGGNNARLKLETLSGEIDGTIIRSEKGKIETSLGNGEGAVVTVETASGDITVNEE